MKRSFFQAVVVSILLYGCTTWTLTKRLEKKLDGNYTRMLRAILNKSWRQHSTKYKLYGHLPPITKTIQVRRTRHAGHCWRSKDDLISDVLLWTPTYGRAKVGRPARTYIQQLCDDTGCSPEDMPEAMNDREKWRERVKDIYAGGTTWWWWWWCIFNSMDDYLRLMILCYQAEKAWWLPCKDGMKPLVADKHPCYEIYIKTNIYIYIYIYIYNVYAILFLLLEVLQLFSEVESSYKWSFL